jgi:hypothetical protein
VPQDLLPLAVDELVVGVADAARLDVDLDLARLGVTDLDLPDGVAPLPVRDHRFRLHRAAILAI